MNCSSEAPRRRHRTRAAPTPHQGGPQAVVVSGLNRGGMPGKGREGLHGRPKLLLDLQQGLGPAVDEGIAHRLQQGPNARHAVAR